MNIFKITFIVVLATVAGMIAAPAAPRSSSSAVNLKGGETPEQIQAAYTQAINSLVPDLGKPDGKPLRSFEAILHHAARPGAEPERLACCKAIASALESDAAVPAKSWMLKLVAFAGRTEVVPAIAKLLEGPEPQLREMARYALQQNPAPEAAEALRNALVKATRENQDANWQAALLLALGARKDAASMPIITALLAQKNETVHEAALVAFGAIGGSEPVNPRPGVWQTSPEKLRDLAAESYMKVAERLLRTGQADQAAAMYGELYQPQQSRPVRMAALVGLLKSTGDQAANKILDILTGDDKDARAIATGVIPDLAPGALKVLASGLGKLPAESQVLVLGTLAERGEKAALPAALEFAASKDEKMQLAGLTALGRLGDASTVPVLVAGMQAGGNAAGTAKASLTQLMGTGVDERIFSAMQSQTDSGRRAALIEVIENRGNVAAVPLLLVECVKDSGTIRRAAMHALGKLAQPKDVPGMIKGLLKAPPGTERGEAEKAIATVCARSAERGQQAEAVVALYNAATPSERLPLLPILGRLGGPKAFEIVKAALASTDAETYQSAVDAISNWPDSDDAVEAELLTLAQKPGKNQDRAAALRAYIQVISIASGLPETNRLAKFQKAMQLAENDEEKKLILERVAAIKHIQTLRFELPYLDNPALAQHACSNTVEIARDRNLRAQHKPEFQEALKKVLTISKEQAILDRANRYLKE